MPNWYPNNKEELKKSIKSYLIKTKDQKINGLIVPHAGYQYSGKIAGKAYSLLQNKKFKQIIVFGPSHYASFYGITTLDELKTPLGEIKLDTNDLRKLKYEHSVDNQIPFLQYLGIKNILPIVVGDITHDNAKNIVKQYNKKDTLFIFSTDLSHFLPLQRLYKKR